MKSSETNLRVAIRVDSSQWLGSGHLNRCLTLAEKLKKKGAYIKFFCRKLKGSSIELIKKSQFDVELLPLQEPQNAYSTEEFINLLHAEQIPDALHTSKFLEMERKYDWVIVDHYALDYEWEKELQKYTKRVFVIDDLANRKHDCHAILDQNYHKELFERYHSLVPDFCEMLLGTGYLLLRPEFLKNNLGKRKRSGEIKRVLVFFGGNDATNETEKTLIAIKMLNRPLIHFDIVVGAGNDLKDFIKEECLMIPQTSFHCQIDYMAELMDKADLAIGAGGATTWERCYLGLPALVVTLAENQRSGIEELEETGAFINLGSHEHLSSEDIAKKLIYLIQNPKVVNRMSKCAKKLMHVQSADPDKDWTEIFFRK